MKSSRVLLVLTAALVGLAAAGEIRQTVSFERSRLNPGAPNRLAKVGPELTGLLARADAGSLLPLSIMLTEQANTDQLEARCRGLDKEARWALVVSELKSLSARSQTGLLSALSSPAAQGKVRDITPFWIVNGIYCRATPDVIRAIAGLDGVWYVESDNLISPNVLLITPETVKRMSVKGNVRVSPDALPEWNVRIVGADSVWHLLGYHGDSVIVGHIDTGCNYNHVDLASHMWTDPNYPCHGWNFELNDSDPMDVSGHGTHTSGTVASDGTAGDTCGMAPKAQIMVCRTKTSIGQPYPDTIAENTVLNSMQFCVAPPRSPSHHAQCITMSLGWIITLWNPHEAIWRQAVTNVSTAGLPFLIAAGNERGQYNPPYVVRCPGHVPGPWHHPAEADGGRGGAITIAATTESDDIASFSSPGPVTWDTIHPYLDYPMPTGLIKPDVAAPGDNITSCNYQDIHGYLSGWQGTSMATPCVAGIVALMLQKNPELLPWQADSILQMSVLPLGSQPKNNDFGTGRISAFKAVTMTPMPGGLRAVGRAIIDDPLPGGNGDSILNPGETAYLKVWVKNSGHRLTSGVGAVLHSLDPSVSIVDSLKSLGDIPAGDSVITPGNGFQFRVGDTCSNGHKIAFRILCTDALDTTWTSDFGTSVGKCILEFAAKRVNDPTPGGNNNGRLDAGETDELFLILRDTGAGHAYSVQAVLRSSDPLFTVIDSVGAYALVRVDTTGENTANPFVVHIDSSVPGEAQFLCSLLLSSSGDHYSARLPVTVKVGELRPVDAIHDNKTPPLYWAVDNADRGYSQRPDFDWIEARGHTCLHLSADQTGLVPLPATFGPFKMYGETYSFLMACSNGWVCGGVTSNTSGSNTPLPSSTLPGNTICANWDELNPSVSNNIWFYHDRTRHAFVIEYDSVPYADTTLGADKFEIVIFDSSLAASDGSNKIKVQYMTANGFRSSTIGIQDFNKAFGINCLCDSAYNRGTAEILPGSAIQYTADVSRYAVDEARAQLKTVRFEVFAAQNPFHGSGRIMYSLPATTQARLSVYDVSGRAVRTFSIPKSPAPGLGSLTWDGRDAAGRNAAPGIYFYRLEAGQDRAACKVIKLD